MVKSFGADLIIDYKTEDFETQLKDIVDKVFPFEQTNEALSYIETGRSSGKVVVKVK